MAFVLFLISALLSSPSAFSASPPECPQTFKEAALGKSILFQGKELFTAKVSKVRPTQMAVGFREVKEKEKEVSKLLKYPKKLDEYLKENALPTVIGPGNRLYVIDHHHLGLALSNLGIKNVYRITVADLSGLAEEEFWKTMEERHWVYPFDASGKGPLPIRMLPRYLTGMKDDPYRSLAGAVRDAGGFDKTDTPFMEFNWANFFRNRIRLKSGEKGFKDAVKEATKLAHSDAARDLPGFKAR